MSELTIADYQKAVDKWVQRFGVRYFSELTNLGILMEQSQADPTEKLGGLKWTRT